MSSALFDFFVSHNRADKAWVRALVGALRARGARVFFDDDGIRVGDDIVAAISRSLDASIHVVLVLSATSVASRWVALEFASAMAADPDASDRRILPLMLEPCDVPLVLRRLKQLDARDRDHERCATELVACLETVRDAPRQSRADSVDTLASISPLSSQYVERDVDQRLDDVVHRRRAFCAFGPRMVGKTSLLRRLMAKAELTGSETLFLDHAHLQGGLLPALARLLLARRADADVSDVLDALDAKARAARSGRLLLAVDELDALFTAPDAVQAMDILRVLATRPSSAVACVVAGCRPPWLWPAPEITSPWWNAFEGVAVPPFSAGHIAGALRRLGLPDEAVAAQVYDLTGGHPSASMSVVKALTEGVTMAEIAGRIDDLVFSVCAGWFSHLIHGAQSTPRDVLSAILAGADLGRTQALDVWLKGLTREPSPRAPQLMGTLARQAVQAVLA